jgi:DNA modification methylase
MSDQWKKFHDPMEQATALNAFINDHARSFDPVADDYDCEAFTSDIKSEGRSAYYNFHYYHTKVPPEVIRDLIAHYTAPGDLILDPFCGSGMTGLGCLLADYDAHGNKTAKDDSARSTRSVILNDLSPAACHIAGNYNSFVDPELIEKEFRRISEKLQPQISELYSTEHYEPASGVYDLRNPEVAGRVKSGDSKSNLIPIVESPDWEVVSREEVQRRLGFPLGDLSYLDNSGLESDKWIVIPARMQYTVWTDVFLCQGLVPVTESTGKISTRGARAGSPILKNAKVARGCGKLINLWQCATDKSTGEVLDSFSCPHCDQTWKKVQLTRHHSEPVEVSYRYAGLKSLKRGIVSSTISRSRSVSTLEIARIDEIARFKRPDTFVDAPLDVGREMMRHGLLKRGIEAISDFYTPRNLYALALFWGEILAIEEEHLRDKLQFCFTSQVMRASRLRRMRPFGPGEQLSGTLYIAALTVETNVFNMLEHAVTEFCQVFPRWMLHTKHDIFIRCGSATNLNEIPDETIDFVFTDPPFGKNIFYADCAMLWENWLGLQTDESKELVVNERRVGGNFKSPDDYGRQMQDALTGMFRVLKPGRFALVEFNNSDGAIFDVVKSAITGAGFDIAGMFVFDKGVKTFKQLKGVNQGEAVVDKDVMFTLSKPTGRAVYNGREAADLERQVAEAVRLHLERLPERIKVDSSKYSDDHRTTATINSMLMNTLIPQGVSVERLSLMLIERVCRRYFRRVGNRWYLRGEAVEGSLDNRLVEDEATVLDEKTAITWIRQRVQNSPMLIGELKPLWMRATGLLPPSVSRDLSLEDLLSENFWRDPDSNRWREPTDEEREKMNDDRSIRVLHDADRYIASSLHRATTDAERCDWIDVLFRACRQVEDGDMQSAPALRGFNVAEAYRVITKLFQSILRENVSVQAYVRAQKQATVASNRISQSVRDDEELVRNERIKIKGPSLFDGVD